jgi:N6-adenosine-specific RNA methylase IME4
MNALAKMDLVVPERPPAPIIPVDDIRGALEAASAPAEIIEISAKLDAFEQYMHDCGLYSVEDMRPINETRMRARWKLGRALAEVQRDSGPGRGNIEKKLSGFTSFLADLGMTKPTAQAAQRIGTLPANELAKAFDQWRERGELLHYADLLLIARPYWYQEKRRQTHQRIKDEAEAAQAPEQLGPFPLIYLDPPWVFETHTPDMTHRMPDDHYPTMTDDEIVAATFCGRTISEMATDDGTMFMWCTSSNLLRALRVMERLGFTYKTHAIWDKEKIGLGLIYRNQHEVLLYGSRGNPPKPMYLPPSVYRIPRTRHSAKPPEVRADLERMYPVFGEEQRVEIFARGQIQGWTCIGYEVGDRETAA